jgi:hypothetical protein
LVNTAEHGHVSELVVRSQIKSDLEKKKNFEMDKKTLRRIIENLKRDNLIKTKDFQIQIKPSSLTVSDNKHSIYEGQMILKTILLAPDCTLTDEDLMRENQTIANPTNKKNKHELASSDEDEHDFSASVDSLAKVKLEPVIPPKS